MKAKHQAMAVAAGAMMFFSGLTTGTAAAAEEIKCSTPVLTSVSVHLANPGLWAYTYQASWCVEKDVITAIAQHVTHEADGKKCVWVTNAEEGNRPVQDGSGAWTAYNMAEFSCKNGDGTDGSVNPWAIITLLPSGASSVLRKGIGDDVVE
jgi:hypothetical protein